MRCLPQRWQGASPLHLILRRLHSLLICGKFVSVWLHARARATHQARAMYLRRFFRGRSSCEAAGISHGSTEDGVFSMASELVNWEKMEESKVFEAGGAEFPSAPDLPARIADTRMTTRLCGDFQSE